MCTITFTIFCSIEPRCSNFDLRLVDGSTPFMGIVQVCESQDWHTICAEGWDTVDASVVCRQLDLASKGLSHKKHHSLISKLLLYVPQGPLVDTVVRVSTHLSFFMPLHAMGQKTTF